MTAPHPLQPLQKDAQGVWRFKKNHIVEYLLDHGGIDMNQLARMDFPQEDREQFAQLIGYSLSGFGDLHYVSEETYRAAQEEDQRYKGAMARYLALCDQLQKIRQGVKMAACAAFTIHEDDLQP